MKKVIRLKESDLQRIVKRVLKEEWNDRRREVTSFQDYNDYINGTDTDIVVYEKSDNFLITRRGEYGAEVVIKTYDKNDYDVNEVVNIANKVSDEDKFRKGERQGTNFTLSPQYIKI
jgi:hypothetical protein